MEDEILFEAYTRVTYNFDTCMSCLQDLIQICQEQQNFKVAQRIEQCLQSIVPAPKNF